jgi:hypothetical protein
MHACCLLRWSQDVVAALLTGPASAGQQLQQLQARCVLQLEELTELVRGALSSLERKVSKGADPILFFHSPCDILQQFEQRVEVVMEELAVRSARSAAAITISPWHYQGCSLRS